MNMNDLEILEGRFPPRANLPEGAEATRVAPSPTGRPHIGTALQAVIDRAIASQSGGRFVLRIEDTDRRRLVEGAVEEILDSLEWLGLTPDEGPGLGGEYGPYVQCERVERYQAAGSWLAAHGHAYWCFCSPERLERLRQEQEAAGLALMYDGLCRTLTPDVVEQRLAMGEKAVLRLSVPADSRIVFQDPTRGEIVFDTSTVDDTVLLKSDGYPTYHLAVVVDDHFMRVTTAVRGEEWISSTPKHVLLYRYFGWQMPRIIHTPLLRDVDRRKLSKRSGDTSIEWFRRQGYLAEGFRNFLTRIIWPHPEGKDVYSFSEFISRFSASELPKTGPVVDISLLDFINGQYIRSLSPSDLYDVTMTWLTRLCDIHQDVALETLGKTGKTVHTVRIHELDLFRRAFAKDKKYSESILSLEQERFKKLGDIVQQCGFFYPETFAHPTPEMINKPLGDAAKAAALLEKFVSSFDPSDSKESWEAKIRQIATDGNVQAGKLFMTIRIAVTGAERTPPLYEVMELLGEEEASARVRMAISALLSLIRTAPFVS